ncbi:MAG TPA: MBL fold metallo-hydrolase [Acidimicrobiales bacterium]|nr:MBL fold metallo-hydrolase [Acidimicrobiales bacterium]
MKVNRRCQPALVAPDTYVIRQLFGEGLGPAAEYVNSMLIAGPEAVIVDTGPAVARHDWMDDVFSIVDPGDVRYVFLSHDDADHVGNLREALEPTTRGLLDTRTGVYWGVDSFGTPVPAEVTDVAELPPDSYQAAFLQMNRMLSPWHRWLDSSRYGTHLDRVRSLGASVVANAHGPALRGDQIGAALDMLAQLPDMPAAAAPWPGAARGADRPVHRSGRAGRGVTRGVRDDLRLRSGH